MDNMVLDWLGATLGFLPLLLPVAEVLLAAAVWPTALEFKDPSVWESDSILTELLCSLPAGTTDSFLLTTLEASVLSLSLLGPCPWVAPAVFFPPHPSFDLPLAASRGRGLPLGVDACGSGFGSGRGFLPLLFKALALVILENSIPGICCDAGSSIF